MNAWRTQPLGRTVYGVLLNDQAQLTRLAPELAKAPYEGVPTSPVLYIKPRNTFAGEGAQVVVPEPPGQVRIDATIGLVMGARATRLSPAQALRYVAGYVLVSELTLPHDNLFRPATVERCRDGFCPMSRLLTPGADFDLAQAELTVRINGALCHQRRFDTLVRSATELLCEVTDFMTFSPNDVLLLGAADGAPLAQAGDQVEISVPGLGSLSHSLVADAHAEALP